MTLRLYRTASARTFLCLAVASLVGCAGGPPADEKEPRAAARRALVGVRDRLLLMEDVAAWKWNAGKLDPDPKREEALVSEIVTECEESGMDGEWVRALILAQIEAAKLVQQDCFRRWKAEARGKFDNVPDLHSSLRPKIDVLSRRLVSYAAVARLHVRHPRWRQIVQEEAAEVMAGQWVSEEARSVAVAPLLSP